MTPERLRTRAQGVPIGHDPDAVPERIDRVQVTTRHGSVEISWASRQAIVHELHGLELSAVALRAFEATGTSRPVQLDRLSIAVVIDAINVLAGVAGGVRHLEPGVASLNASSSRSCVRRGRQRRRRGVFSPTNPLTSATLGRALSKPAVPIRWDSAIRTPVKEELPAGRRGRRSDATHRPRRMHGAHPAGPDGHGQSRTSRSPSPKLEASARSTPSAFRPKPSDSASTRCASRPTACSR